LVKSCRTTACITLAALSAVSARAQDAGELPRRGPFEIREEWLLAQPRLTLPALSPDPLRPGASTLRLDLDWGSDFARRTRRYFVDGEHRSLALSFRRGVSECATLGLRLPLRARDGGIMDRFIDAFHGFTKKLGLPDNGRTMFARDQLVVSGRKSTGEPLAWTGASGSGLGKLEIEGLWSLARRDDSRFALSLAARLALPTGTGPFAGGGVETGAQLLLARSAGRAWDFFSGLGVAHSPRREAEGLGYARVRGYGFLGLEWRPGRRWSVIGQYDGATRLLNDVAGYPAYQSYLRLGLKRDLGRTLTAEAGFSENILRQQATTDFGLWFGLTRRFR
jgi:hypothetical protein